MRLKSVKPVLPHLQAGLGSLSLPGVVYTVQGFLVVRIVLSAFWGRGTGKEYFVFVTGHILKISLRSGFFFFSLQQIHAELLFPKTPLSGQTFTPVKESVPRGHLSEVANTYSTRLINHHRGSPQSEPENNRSVAKMCFSIWEMTMTQPLLDTFMAVTHF